MSRSLNIIILIVLFSILFFQSSWFKVFIDLSSANDIYRESAYNQFINNHLKTYLVKNNNKSSIMSLKSKEVNGRSGPSIDYPIIIKYKQKYIPIITIQTYNDWTKIIDYFGQISWVKTNLLMNKKTGLVIKDYTPVYKNNQQNNHEIIAFINKNNILLIEYCEKEICKINLNNISGYISKSLLWGNIA